ncbi:MAG: ABC transporter ATP-binding protein [Acidimicrobiales bacterium]
MTVVVSHLTVTVESATLLHDVSMTVAPGEWVAVVGPNGAGKSTLLRAIAALTSRQGTITIGGRDIGSLRPRDRARLVAMVVQSPLVPVGATVTDYVALGRTPHVPLFGVETTDDLAAVAAALHRLDLDQFAQRAIETLSGGERQRVLLARALAQDAPVLLLDEPTTALDVGHQQETLELIDDLRRERNLVVITSLHDLTLAAQYADRVVLLDRGHTVADGPPLDVLTEGILAAVFGASIRVIHDEHGITIVTRRSARSHPHA